MRLAAPLFILFLSHCFPVIAMGASGETADRLKFSHTPVYSTPAGSPIPVRVTLSRPLEIREIRLYFKVIRAADYVYIPFRKTGTKEYAAERNVLIDKKQVISDSARGERRRAAS